MPIQKSQMHRLMRIAALLKENRYPNSETLVREFRRIAVEEELEIECGKKTILRDMKVLEYEFGCSEYQESFDFQVKSDNILIMA